MSINLTEVVRARNILTSEIDRVRSSGSSPPPAASVLAYPFHMHLFAPVQIEGALVHTPTNQWAWPGEALSASTGHLAFRYGFPPVTFARAIIVWSPGSVNNGIRIVHADDGPTNITEMGRKISTESTQSPRAHGIILTDQLNELVNNKVSKHVGYQVIGDGTPMTIYEVTLEITFGGTP
jgi:hypothetical protein